MNMGVNTDETVTLALDGGVVRTCHKHLSCDGDELPFDADLSALKDAFRQATPADSEPTEKDWLVTLERMEWVAVYGRLYTLNDTTESEDVQAAMMALMSRFDDSTTRMAEHTRDFSDAVKEARE